MRTAVFTICSLNYLAYARVLLSSCRDAGVAADRFLFLCDEAGEGERSVDLPAAVVEARDLGIPGFDDMAFRYDVMEMNTAIKPFCIQELWDRGYEAVIYLDPDIFVLRPLEEVDARLRGGADIVLTPHLLSPIDDDCHPGETEIMQSGVYNLGFGAFARTPGARRFVSWWADRLRTRCVSAPERGLFVDQRLADLAPCFVDDAAILRHPGYNVAYWNHAQRAVREEGGTWTAKGEPLTFYHFSGVQPPRKDVYSKHQDRLTPERLGPARALLERYVDALVEGGHETQRAVPYAYGTYSDGTPVPDVVRRVLRDLAGDRPLAVSRPFNDRAAVEDAVNAPARALRQRTTTLITELMHHVWKGRADLQDAFPLSTREGQEGFAAWFAHSATRELGLPGTLVPAPTSPVAPDRGVDRAKRAAASRILARANTLRPLYRRLPQGVRNAGRDVLLRAQVPPPLPEGGVPLTDLKTLAALPRRPLGVLVQGYLRAETGVGAAARRTVDALADAAVPVLTRPLPSGADGDRQAFSTIRDADDPSVVLSQVNADRTLELGRWVPARDMSRRYHVGYWAWELARFPEAWWPALTAVHEVWAPSRFVADSLERAMADGAPRRPVAVVPHPLRRDPLGTEEDARIVDEARQATRQDLGLADGTFAVLVMLDVNSFPARKNPDGALAAFSIAKRESRREMRLVVKMHGRRNHPARYEAIKAELSRDPDVVLVEDILDDAGIIALQASCDAYLSLHRSEGFGLVLAEMMQLGRPVIATGYGGVTDFLSDATGHVVPHTLVPVPDDAYPFAEGQVWAEPDIEAAAVLIGRVANDASGASAMGRAARAHVKASLSSATVGALMRARLEAALDALSPQHPQG